MAAARRMLVVGAGTMGGMYARMVAAGRVPGAELAGVVDIDGARALELANATGCRAFGDIETAVRELRPDFAYVATPDGLHRAPVESLAGLGVAILVEKPLATTNEDAAAMLEAVRRAGVHAEVNYTYRWFPPLAEAMRTVDSGELGELRTFNAYLNYPVASPRERLHWSGGTTPAWFLMSHLLDLVLWLGRKRAMTVYASGGRGELAGHGIETYDWVHAVVRYADGADGVFEACWILPDSWPAPAEFRLKAIGTQGVLEVDGTAQGLMVAGERVRLPGALQWAPARLQAFLRGMAGEGRPGVSFEDGAEVTRVLVALHRSLEHGTVERL
ncbi:Gfo/Idh/MocA family oxidoreductase [Tepidiforma sp.]|uniref:Gfo/Idh/MocA family protein n=1 Tax=Tepidiforma sp. TaxID=2682230 RepID=UPI002ADDE775|nr:Gfo/Idh/MocA family oxidoreductase [Tepidiforma sp.]